VCQASDRPLVMHGALVGNRAWEQCMETIQAAMRQFVVRCGRKRRSAAGRMGEPLSANGAPARPRAAHDSLNVPPTIVTDVNSSTCLKRTVLAGIGGSRESGRVGWLADSICL
jgi:hypothetical protein